MRILFIEPNISIVSPLKTKAHALESEGVVSTFIDPQYIDAKTLIKTYLKSDVVIIQYYCNIPEYTKMQLALASVLMTPVIRNWAGSDSLFAITEPLGAFSAKQTDRLLSGNITNTHQGIVDELNNIDISCKLLPQLIDKEFDLFSADKALVRRAVVAYIPTGRRKFYGADYLEKLIEKYPQVVFYIVADDEHFFAKYDNVKSVGWVDDMEPVWNSVGLVVRMTEHDGYPRMFTEALARGKYIIHNNAFPGVWLAKTQVELEAKMDEYLAADDINREGIKVYEQRLRETPARVHYDYISSIKVTFKKWWSNVLYIFKYKVRALYVRDL